MAFFGPFRGDSGILLSIMGLNKWRFDFEVTSGGTTGNILRLLILNIVVPLFDNWISFFFFFTIISINTTCYMYGKQEYWIKYIRCLITLKLNNFIFIYFNHERKKNIGNAIMSEERIQQENQVPKICLISEQSMSNKEISRIRVPAKHVHENFKKSFIRFNVVSH